MNGWSGLLRMRPVCWKRSSEDYSGSWRTTSLQSSWLLHITKLCFLADFLFCLCGLRRELNRLTCKPRNDAKKSIQ